MGAMVYLKERERTVSYYRKSSVADVLYLPWTNVLFLGKYSDYCTLFCFVLLHFVLVCHILLIPMY